MFRLSRLSLPTQVTHPITRQFGLELVAVVLLVLPVLPPFCSAQRAGSAASIGAASRTTLKTAWRVLPGALAQIHSLTVGSAACPVMPVQSPQREQNRLPEPTPPTALVPMVPLPTAPTVPTRVTKRERTHSHSTPGPSEEQLAAWPEELTKPLPAAVVARMLLDDRYQPGRRPYAFDPLGGTFVFKEHAGSLEVVARLLVRLLPHSWVARSGLRSAHALCTT